MEFVVVLAAAWLSVLTLLVLVLVRQVAVLTVRSTGPGPLEGIGVGARASAEAVRLLPELSQGRAVVILSSATCGPCRELLADMASVSIAVPTTLLLPGSVAAAEPLIDLVPEWVRLVRDPDAERAASELQVNRTPFAFVFADARLVAKRSVRTAQELVTLIEGTSDAVGGVRVANPRLTEETGHGG